MNIIVLIKQVPATDSQIEIAADGVSIRRDALNLVMNPYDELAVEEALRIREIHGGRVTLLSVGPDSAKDALRTGIAMGADEAMIIDDAALSGIDGLVTARLLAAAIRRLPYDVVIAGQRAVDDEQYLVGPAVAAFLGIPAMTLVTHQEIADGKIRCRRAIDGGTLVLEAPLRALFTTQRGINEPRYTSLKGVMKAKKTAIPALSPNELGIDAAALVPKVLVRALQPPPKRPEGHLIDGANVQEKVRNLVSVLQKEAGLF